MPVEFLPQAKNGRTQDLFLLAKGEYDAGQLRLSECARRIIGFHNMSHIDRMGLRDAAWVVVNDLLPLVMDRIGTRWADFLVSLGPHNCTGYSRHFSQVGRHPDGYYPSLIEAILEQVRVMRIREESRWLLPFDPPQIDPFVCEILRGKVHPSALQSA